ncbi:hypothetical protein BHE74_00057261 [Ensete ventricosum]|nr:hypothetical protein GW17_00000831 [Ensete ventricosum]RWW37600.1 hypothetical protein BHE74_00057261 [Ensete ventricosum]
MHPILPTITASNQFFLLAADDPGPVTSTQTMVARSWGAGHGKPGRTLEVSSSLSPTVKMPAKTFFFCQLKKIEYRNCGKHAGKGGTGSPREGPMRKKLPRHEKKAHELIYSSPGCTKKLSYQLRN